MYVLDQKIEVYLIFLFMNDMIRYPRSALVIHDLAVQKNSLLRLTVTFFSGLRYNKIDVYIFIDYSSNM